MKILALRTSQSLDHDKNETESNKNETTSNCKLNLNHSTSTMPLRELSRKPLISHLKTMCTIRLVEEALLESFGMNALRGTTHTSIGQEAIAVAAMSMLSDEDIVFSNHRCHGHFIAYCGDVFGLIAEIAGLSHGVCKGIGGSQHLFYRNFYSNGILGGTVPVAVGAALGESFKDTSAIAVCFLGDGALGQGVVYESLNIASLWRAPILFVVENNRYAQSTPIELNLAGSIKERFEAYAIVTTEIESNDLGDLLPYFDDAFRYVREHKRPRCIIVNTFRMGPHSKGDDTRPVKEIVAWKERDPLVLVEKYFQVHELRSVRENTLVEVNVVMEETLKFRAQVQNLPSSDDSLIPLKSQTSPWFQEPTTLLVNHLNAALHNLFQSDQRVLLIGEDLLDPYGGAFKVSKGLSTKFPSRVLSSPVSEAGITGVANGLALRGLRPIVELMFGDFSTLVLDQLLNHASKFQRMYGGNVNCPIIVRAPMGGYRGYGPTHSQSLEKLFIGIPGLTVIACDSIHDQSVIWSRMIELNSPCVYIENKALYGLPMKARVLEKIDNFFSRSTGSFFPTAELQMEPFDYSEPDLVIIAYGGMVPLAMATALRLYIEEERVTRVVVPAQLAPIPVLDLFQSLGTCRRLVTLEEGTQRAGWGAEVVAILSEKYTGLVFRRAATQDTIIGTSKVAEETVLPSEENVYSLAIEVLNVI